MVLFFQMKLLLLIILFGLLALSIGQAKLGDTKDKLISRYGRPYKEENKKREHGGYWLTLSFEQYEIQALVVSEKVGGVEFFGTTEAICFQGKNGEHLKKEEMRHLMGKYGEEKDWQRLKESGFVDGEEYRLKEKSIDNGVICVLFKEQPAKIVFMSEKYYYALAGAMIGQVGPWYLSK